MDSGPVRSVVVVPGVQFGPHVPLLMYAGQAASRRGASVWPVSWNPPRGGDLATYEPWVRDRLTPVVDKVTADGQKPVLIGKSLGTHAAALAAERTLPGIWLTPLLAYQTVVDAIGRATAPCLLVGGTADHHWDGERARKLSPYVLEVEGADHGMFVPGPMAASAAVLGEVVTAVERFLDDVVWR